MSKSHYFVQKPPEEQLGFDVFKECPVCGKPFEGRDSKKKYCSRECYLLAQKEIKRKWYLKNKERVIAEKNDRRHARGVTPLNEYLRLYSAKKFRKRIIKRDLVGLELMTFQVLNENKLHKLDMHSSRKKVNPAKARLIKSRLEELDLYEEQIKELNKKKLDYSKEYTGYKVKVFDEEVL